jgi:hypothetical protein
VKHESRQPAIGDESKFAVAIADKRINQGTQEELKQVLKYVMVLVGLRAQNYPGKIEKQILLNFIFEHYGGHTPAEIKLAFEMAITRKLEVDPTCYENFSVAYFAGIMEAYREWSREQYKTLPVPKEQIREFSQADKLLLDLDYAYLMLEMVDKLPCKIGNGKLQSLMYARRFKH